VKIENKKKADQSADPYDTLLSDVAKAYP